MTSSTRSRNGSTLSRAMRILNAFSHSNPELNIAEIARLAGIPKPTAFRMLSALAARNMIEYRPTSETYLLGYSVLRIADVILSQSRIRTIVRPEMLRINNAINETVVLTVRQGFSRINFDSVESTHSIQHILQFGVATSLYADAPGRVLLADLPDDEIRKHLGSPTVAKPKRLEPDTLMRKIKIIRRRGYDVSDAGDTGQSVLIAAPISIGTQKTEAALYVAIPSGRADAAVRSVAIRAIVKSSHLIETAASKEELSTN